MGGSSGLGDKKYADLSDDATISRDIECIQRNKNIGLEAIIDRKTLSKGQKNFNKFLIGTLIFTSSLSAGSYIFSKFAEPKNAKIAEDVAAYSLLAAMATGAAYGRTYIFTGLGK